MEKAFSDIELQNIIDFENEHLNCYRAKKSLTKVLGFTIHQSFGSGIGINTTITCDCCGKSKDITDYDCW